MMHASIVARGCGSAAWGQHHHRQPEFNLHFRLNKQPRNIPSRRHVTHQASVLSLSLDSGQTMRLLRYDNDGAYSLVEFDEDVPRYAILSHTWGAEEVTFGDMTNGQGKNKAGYDKIQFCGDQASRDGLKYFWVDTCCIDKWNSTELGEAINSMFRWYRDAAKCYVYLSDVSRSPHNNDEIPNQLPWDSSFRRSRWFTRGWTLQELIAPTSVEFFSKDRELIGSKVSLERQMCEITRIHFKALRGNSLSDFSIQERMSWIENRSTTKKEDKAYSLLGIFDVSMAPIYGEGEEKAFQRLREKIKQALKGPHYEDFDVAFSLSNVSETQNFVARETELRKIHESLGGDGYNSRRIVVLHGLGGIGKTQLTVAYAKRYRENYSAVFWLNIKDEDSLKQSFTKIATQISREHPSASQLSSIDMTDGSMVVDAVKSWLSLPDNTRWLIIYDNYDNPKVPGNININAVDIRKYLPESYHGSVIITTRSSEVTIGHCIRITKLELLQDSLDILANTSGRDGLNTDPHAIRLAEKLDGLPLALATTGAYLKQSAISFSNYLRLYEKSWADLQKKSPELSSYEDRTLYSTWQLSFDNVKARNSLSANLLRFWAYFDNQDIWYELLQHSDYDKLDWIKELVEDEMTFENAVRVLSDHGLVEVEMSSQEQNESGGYSIHGCVHSWAIHVLNREWDYKLAKAAIKSVASHIPGDEAIRPWLTQRRLLQHAARCSFVVLNSLVTEDNIEWALHVLGNLYSDQGKLTQAEEMYERALKGYEKALGPDHTSTLNTVNNLGLLYADQGKLVQAEEMYERALKGTEKALGPDHTSTLSTGKLVQAEEMYERALKGKEKALGPDHTSTLNTVNNLGTLYADQGKLVQAEEMYERALKGTEKALGPDHTLTLNTVNNLGLLYTDQGKLVQAEEMYERALEGYEKALRPDHTLTLHTVANLGLLYKDQGKLVQAEEMYERVLEGYRKTLGSENISTLDTLSELGSLFEIQSNIARARIIYLEALVGYQKALGPDHPKSQGLHKKLRVLDTRAKETITINTREPINISQGETSRRGSKGILPESKRYKVLQKLGLHKALSK
ncbi:HET-domain-containing protein [Coleophoma crateriformis]|uniref:HET-domain-containing protein n=1 Tax=Coleophoma crateriformis TaxID=565419 RepID=A0A3D8Q5K1_9HELO|nr:HET-domain-containing protein [Coleophoma crateriformis]